MIDLLRVLDLLHVSFYKKEAVYTKNQNKTFILFIYIIS